MFNFASTSSFNISPALLQALTYWRSEGPECVLQYLSSLDPLEIEQCPFLSEIKSRCVGQAGPRLLIDGIWFVRSFGGISRVWQQILRTWSLPGLNNESAQILLIDRDSHLPETDRFVQIDATHANPFDWSAFRSISDENGQICKQYSADVFLSSWISSSGSDRSSCSELALVHDCIPERISSLDEPLRLLRRRWLTGASSHLAVSQSTAQDVALALGSKSLKVDWCHPSTVHFFQDHEGLLTHNHLLSGLALPSPYLLLPASAAIGTYKNPELVLAALSDPRCSSVNLLLTGQSSLPYVSAFEDFHTSLRGRVFSRSFTDLELQLAYQHALSVVVPSRFEGFGLPVIEALASGGYVISTDVPGLREASGGCVPCLDPDCPQALADWVALLLDPASAYWIRPHLQRRRLTRLSRLHPDLLGLGLLIKARQLFESASG